jgi:SOS-response transcriptional repressor LexA
MMLTTTQAKSDELTARQREVWQVAADYYRYTGEPCSVRYIARRLQLCSTRVHQHLTTLRDRKWLEGTRPIRPT